MSGLESTGFQSLGYDPQLFDPSEFFFPDDLLPSDNGVLQQPVDAYKLPQQPQQHQQQPQLVAMSPNHQHPRHSPRRNEQDKSAPVAGQSQAKISAPMWPQLQSDPPPMAHNNAGYKPAPAVAYHNAGFRPPPYNSDMQVGQWPEPSAGLEWADESNPYGEMMPFDPHATPYTQLHQSLVMIQDLLGNITDRMDCPRQGRPVARRWRPARGGYPPVGYPGDGWGDHMRY